jgi:DNA-binding response OmpR family regulator
MKKITIVDDEPHVLRVLKLSLERAGYDVSSFSNGEDALYGLRESLPDVLITDIHMPRMTGEELCQHIQLEMPDREFLIFVLTSRTEIEHREWSRKINNLQFLEKPVSIRNLIKRLNEYFENAKDA